MIKFVLLLSAAPLMAASPRGFWEQQHLLKVCQPETNIEEQYAKAMECVEQKAWREAEQQLLMIRSFYASTSYAKEALYQLGVVYYSLGELHEANEYFSRYLSEQHLPEHFLDVLGYKFSIAESYREGRRRPLFGSRNLPKWASGRAEALEIYDEITSCLPSSELAVRCLVSKGKLLEKMGQYLESIEAYQDLVMRFPGHALAQESYLNIARLYTLQARQQSHDPDLLALARLNVRRFRQDYPFDSRVAEAEQLLTQVQEILAAGLIDTAKFWEKKDKQQAATIYYRTLMASYPTSVAAKEAQERLASLEESAPLSKTS